MRARFVHFPTCLPLVAALSLATLSALVVPTAHAESPKLHPLVPELLAGGHAELFVLLDEQADLSFARIYTDKSARTRAVFDALHAVAGTQEPLATELEARGALIERYWVVNALLVDGDVALVDELAARRDVRRIEPNFRLTLPEIVEESPRDPEGVEWNIAMINAPDVWAQGVRGAGAVVGGIDTGYEWTHPAILSQYRGWDGASAVHDYSWHDAIHSGGDGCGPDVPEPCDVSGHGTHTMGTMVGDDGGTNVIGVAPEAEWIGCRAWQSSDGTQLSYVTECFQWMIAPTDLAGQNPDPAMAPHAITNSWICEPSEGCVDPLVLQLTVENVRAAGILVEASAGNDGPACSSIRYPPAIYDASFTVGATTSTDDIASFSSWGPVSVDGSNRQKPDVSAPGQGIRSANAGGGYAVFSGTSMAGPHVTGLAALLVSANPSLAGDVDALEEIIRSTAVPLTSPINCGLGGQVPNNLFGWGRIDALAAYQAALPVSVDDPVPPIAGRMLRVTPEPVRRTAEIRIRLDRVAALRVELFDATGRLVRVLADESRARIGEHLVRWDVEGGARRPARGTYFLRVRVGDRSETRRLTVL